MLEHPKALWPLLIRDLVVTLGARSNVDASMLDAISKRRSSVYSSPSKATMDEHYWTLFATVLAPVGPPEWMPMSGLIENGTTLEGGARGLRGLIFREPSEKERRKVLKIATLAARVMDIVASATHAFKTEEQRLVAMAMASFGLTLEELEKTRSAAPVTFDSIEIFGDLDARTRRELLRGAWQLGLQEALDPAKDVVVRGIAARLEVSMDYDAVRTEVAGQLGRQTELATLAVDLLREPARSISGALQPHIDHLIDSTAPPAQRQALKTRAKAGASAPTVAATPLDSTTNRRAISLALATLLAPDARSSTVAHLRAELHAAAHRAGADADLEESFKLVDRFVFERMREYTLAPPPTPPPPPQSPPSETKPTPGAPSR